MVIELLSLSCCLFLASALYAATPAAALQAAILSDGWSSRPWRLAAAAFAAARHAKTLVDGPSDRGLFVSTDLPLLGDSALAAARQAKTLVDRPSGRGLSVSSDLRRCGDFGANLGPNLSWTRLGDLATGMGPSLSWTRGEA